jgi:cytochrome P450
MVGILPPLVSNLHRFQDHITDLLASSGHNLKVHMGSIRFFITSDPKNIHHIFTSNHANYPKGEEFAEIFDLVRGSLFTVNGETWRRQRANWQSVLSSPALLALMTKCCRDKVGKGLLPFMTHMAITGAPLDMNDLMARLVFDMYATSIFGVDPGRLSLDMPPVYVANAMDTVMEVGIIRQIVPAFCWKAMRRLSMGPERRLACAQAMLRRFTTEMVEMRRKTGHTSIQQSTAPAPYVDVLSSYVDHPDYSDDDLLQATLITYMIAGRDAISTSLPWIFYNLTKNPHVVSNIRDELAPVVARKAAGPTMTIEPEDVKELVYMQATLLESLRLYPPAPIERKSAVADDEMPSGHKVSARDIVFVSIYSMGRMEAIWGADCREYMPERWFSENRRQLRCMPSHKFLVFNSGPRMCLGKEITMTQMKMIVATVIWNFGMEMVDGQTIQPKFSVLLQMKNGLKVKLNKRQM